MVSPAQIVSAGIVRRAAAYMLDGFVILLLFATLHMLIWAVTGGAVHNAIWEMNHRLVSWAWVFTTNTLLVGVLYLSLMESSPWQATLGKRLLGLRVAGIHTRRITFRQAVLRGGVKLIPWELFHFAMIGCTLVTQNPDGTIAVQPIMPAYLAVSATGWILVLVYLTLAAVGTRRTVHDRIAGTVVVSGAERLAPRRTAQHIAAQAASTSAIFSASSTSVAAGTASSPN